MEQRKQNAAKDYQTVYGKAPSTDLVVLSESTSECLVDVLSKRYGNTFLTDASVKKAWFCEVSKKGDKYGVHIVDIQKKRGDHITGQELDLTELPNELVPYVQQIKPGETVEFYCLFDNSARLVKTVSEVVPGKTDSQVNRDITQISKSVHRTPLELMAAPFEIEGDDTRGYMVGLEVLNKLGIHARPAALIAKSAMKYGADTYFKKDDVVVSAKSILNVMILASPKGQRLIAESKGDGSHQCLEEIVSLFKKKFNELA